MLQEVFAIRSAAGQMRDDANALSSNLYDLQKTANDLYERIAQGQEEGVCCIADAVRKVQDFMYMLGTIQENWTPEAIQEFQAKAFKIAAPYFMKQMANAGMFSEAMFGL